MFPTCQLTAVASLDAVLSEQWTLGVCFRQKSKLTANICEANLSLSFPQDAHYPFYLSRTDLDFHHFRDEAIWPSVSSNFQGYKPLGKKTLEHLIIF